MVRLSLNTLQSYETWNYDTFHGFYLPHILLWCCSRSGCLYLYFVMPSKMALLETSQTSLLQSILLFSFKYFLLNGYFLFWQLQHFRWWVHAMCILGKTGLAYVSVRTTQHLMKYWEAVRQQRMSVCKELHITAHMWSALLFYDTTIFWG